MMCLSVQDQHLSLRTLTTTHPAMLSALRGPDDEKRFALLKHQVTARIRVIVYDVQHKYDLLDQYFACNRNPMLSNDFHAIMSWLSQTKITRDHYVSHLIQALHICYEHEIWGGFGTSLREALNQKCYIEGG